MVHDLGSCVELSAGGRAAHWRHAHEEGGERHHETAHDDHRRNVPRKTTGMSPPRGPDGSRRPQIVIEVDQHSERRDAQPPTHGEERPLHELREEAQHGEGGEQDEPALHSLLCRGRLARREGYWRQVRHEAVGRREAAHCVGRATVQDQGHARRSGDGHDDADQHGHDADDHCAHDEREQIAELRADAARQCAHEEV